MFHHWFGEWESMDQRLLMSQHPFMLRCDLLAVMDDEGERKEQNYVYGHGGHQTGVYFLFHLFNTCAAILPEKLCHTENIAPGTAASGKMAK